MEQSKEQRMIEFVKKCISLGLEVIPLIPNTKKPSKKGFMKRDIKDLWDEVCYPFNIGLRMGKVVDFENDDDEFGNVIDKLFEDLGVTDYPVYKSKRGKHRLIILDNKPKSLGTSHLVNPNDPKSEAHLGELIVSTQSVLPESTVNDFTYQWLNDSEKFLSNIPHVNWYDIRNFIKKSSRRKGKHNFEDLVKLRNVLKFNGFKWAESMLQVLKFSKKGQPVEFNKKVYKSRSEAEYSIVLEFVTCLYTYTYTETWFENNLPGHYKEKGVKARKAMLRQIYNEISDQGFRESIKKEHAKISDSKQKDRIYSVLLSIAYQINTNVVFRSYGDLALDIGLPTKLVKSGIQKALKKLVVEGKISIQPGTQGLNVVDKKASSFTLLNIKSQ